ncbi:hypothetical protein D3C81_1139180 [compost metagenome]
MSAYNLLTESQLSAAVHLSSTLPAADSYVRDGSYSGTNYGSATSLVTKNSSSGYTRTVYLSFDLSAYTAAVSEAKVRLVPTYVGAAGNVNVIAAATGAWMENSIVWNNKPVVGAEIANWTGMAAGVAVEIDVTAEVNAAIAAGSGSVSFAVYAPTDTGSTGDVIYGSKEQTVASSRPVLTVSE